jgi:hypothetical protein
MFCARCHRNEGIVPFLPVVNNKPGMTVHLCEECAKDARKTVEAIYTRIAPDNFALLQTDARAAEAFFAPTMEEVMEKLQRGLRKSSDPEKVLARKQDQESGKPYLFLGTDWQALHFLLTGDSDLKAPPAPSTTLAQVVSGGTETPWPCRHGHVHFLTAAEVRAVAGALSMISVEELRARFSAASFKAAEITSPFRRARWTEKNTESLFEVYPQVVEFFHAAARAGNMVLRWFD